MAYNEQLADRLRELLQLQKNIEEKRMFGGLVFMVNKKMCIGINKDDLMVRMIPERYEEALEMLGAKPMDFTGKVMKGFVFVESQGYKSPKQLQTWVDLGLEFAERTKVTKPKVFKKTLVKRKK